MISNTTYETAIRCIPSPGFWDWDETARVVASDGHDHYLRVPRGEIANHAGTYYLPIGLLELDHANRVALVQLPCETDSGYQRLWVALDQFKVVEPTSTSSTDTPHSEGGG